MSFLLSRHPRLWLWVKWGVFLNDLNPTRKVIRQLHQDQIVYGQSVALWKTRHPLNPARILFGPLKLVRVHPAKIKELTHGL